MTQKEKQREAKRIGNQIKTLRLRHKMTHATLAARAGIQINTLSRVERGIGVNGPYANTVRAIASGLGCKTEEIM